MRKDTRKDAQRAQEESRPAIGAPYISRRGFVAAAGTSALSLTALGYVAREARAATLNPDLTMAATANPESAYPEWFPSWDRIVDLAKKEGRVQVSAWGGPR